MVLRGTLVERHTDAIDGSEPSVAYSLRTTVGEVELADEQPEHLIGQRVRVEDASARAGVQGRAVAQDSTRLAAYTGVGAHKVAVILVNFTDNRSTPVTADAIRSTVFTGTSSVNQYYRSQSDGAVSLVGRDRTDGDVYGWYELPLASTGCDAGAIANAARAAVAADGKSLSGYDHFVYYFPRVGACGFAGLGELPGPESWINGYNQTSVIAHELGHNMGVHHAASRACSSGGAPTPLSATCNDTEYGDPFDVMGNGSRLMSSWHRAQLGQLPTAGQKTVLTSGTYALGSVNDFTPGATKLLLIPRRRPGEATSRLFAVEIRSPLGPFDAWSAGAPATTGVTVRLVPQLTNRSQSYLLDAHPADGGFANAPLAPGQSLTDPESGITIATLAAGNGSASVRVTLPAPLDTTPPTAPSDVRASLAGSAVHVTWGASSDDDTVARYEIVRNGVLLASTQATGFDDVAWAGLESATYRVDAVDAAGNRSASVSQPTVALPDVTAPGAPSGLRATRSGSAVRLAWNAATDDRSLRSYVLTRDGVRFADVGAQEHTDAAAGTGAHRYAVAAVDAAGNVGPPATVQVEALRTSAPVPQRPVTPKPQAPPATPVRPTVLLASPWLVHGRARIPSGGTLVFRSSIAGRMTLRLGGRTVRRVRASRLRYRLAKRYRKRSVGRLKVTVVAAGRRSSARYVVRRGVVRRL